MLSLIRLRLFLLTCVLVVLVWVPSAQAATFVLNLTVPIPDNNGCFDNEGVTQTDTVVAPGDIPAGSTLNSLTYDVTVTTADILGDISLVGAYPGGTAFTIPSFTVLSPTDTVVLSGTALGNYSLVWDDSDDNGATATGCGGIGTFDNRVVSYQVTIDYSIPGDDSDGDGIIDGVECPAADPNRDTDGDGLTDCNDIDADNDGIPDNVEAQLTSAGSYIAPTGPDTDGDGLLDVYEPAGLTPVDTDGDGIPDYIDQDSDGEGIPDTSEHNITGVGPVGGDVDGDGLLNEFEGANNNDVDVNDEIDDPENDLPDTDNGGSGDCCGTPLQADVDYRDLSITTGQVVANKVGSAQTGGSTTDVDEDDLIDWLITYDNQTGFTLNNVQVTDVLTGNHTLVSSSFPNGWTFNTDTFSTDKVVATGFGLSESLSEIPVPANVFGATLNGDGYQPIIDPDTGLIYVMFHHLHPGVMNCVDPLTGNNCTGFTTDTPLTATGATVSCDETDGTCSIMTINTNEDTPIVDGKLYYPTTIVPSSVSIGDSLPFNWIPVTWGLGCFDLATNAECDYDGAGPSNIGFVELPNVDPTPGPTTLTATNGVLSGPWLVNGNFYMLDWNMQLHCIEPGTGNICAGSPKSLYDATTMPQITDYDWENMRGEVDGDRLYLAVQYAGTTNSAGLGGARARCLDMTTGTAGNPGECAGWTTGVGSAFSGPGSEGGPGSRTPNLFFVRDTSFDPTLLCMIGEGGDASGWDGCVNVNTGVADATGHENTGIPTPLGAAIDNGGNDGTGLEVYHEGRTYFNRYFENQIFCYDWATNALCTGFGVGGVVTGPVNSESYAITRDPSNGCFWITGDNNELWNFDINGNTPCNVAEVDVDLSLQPEASYCDTGSAALTGAVWEALNLFDIDSDDFTTLTAVIRDSLNAEVTTCDFKTDSCNNGFSVVDNGLNEQVVLTAVVPPPSLPVSGDNISLTVEFDATLPLGVDLMVGGRDPRIELNWDFPSSPPPIELCLVTDPDVSCPVTGTETASNSAAVRIQGSGSDDDTVGPISLNVNPVGGNNTSCMTDYGDAPDSYGTNLAGNGGHVIETTQNTLYIGASVDNEADGQAVAPGANANSPNGDGADEDGVDFRSPPNGFHSEIFADVEVVNDTGSNAFLCAWLDRWDGTGNGDGDFDPWVSDAARGDTPDGVLRPCATVTPSAVPGVAEEYTFFWGPLLDEQGFTYARFRLCSTLSECDDPTGAAITGEVQDYIITFNFATAAIIGEVGLEVVSVDDLLNQLEVDKINAEALLALLKSWNASAAANLGDADAAAILAALIEFLDPDGDGQVVLFQWETLEEMGTIGFYAERQVEDGAWVRINNRMLPGLVSAPFGGDYMLVDPGAVQGNEYIYRLIEIEATGQTQTYGPFMLNLQ